MYPIVLCEKHPKDFARGLACCQHILQVHQGGQCDLGIIRKLQIHEGAGSEEYDERHLEVWLCGECWQNEKDEIKVRFFQGDPGLADEALIICEYCLQDIRCQGQKS